MSNGEKLLNAGEDTGAEAFLALAEGFLAETTAEGPCAWEHGNLVEYLVKHRSFESVQAERIGTARFASSFSNELGFAKKDATIHMPGTHYSLPPWAVQFEPVAREIIEYEHATNPRADAQIAQVRVRQYKGQPRNLYPHIEMIRRNVRNFHLYLVADQVPSDTFEGRFDYIPQPYLSVKDDPKHFFRNLDRQFFDQINEARITRQKNAALDIMALSALTVHEPPRVMPVGRTLFGIQFYELANNPYA